MWSRAQASRADIRDRLSDGHVRSRANAARETTKVTVARHVTVRMPELDEVAVATAPARAHDHGIAHRAHGRAGVRRVVGSLVTAQRPEDRMHAQTEHTRDATKFQRRAQKRRAKRTSVLIEKVASNGSTLEANRLDHAA